MPLHPPRSSSLRRFHRLAARIWDHFALGWRVPAEFAAGFIARERELTIRNTHRGCLLGAILVPLFAFLDWMVYPELARPFFGLRLACAGLMLGCLPLIHSRLGRRHYQLPGVLILLLPTAMIAAMVAITGGSASLYYGGLILVLMFLGVVLEWSFWQSVASVLLVWGLYLAACVLARQWPAQRWHEAGAHYSSPFFLVSTGLVMVIGNWHGCRSRINEFVTQRRREMERERMLGNRAASLGIVAAGLSQSVRTSLVSVRTFLDLSMDPAGVELIRDPGLQHSVRTGLDNIVRLLADLRLVSAPRSGAGLPPAQDIAEVVRTVVTEMQTQFNRRRVNLNLAAEASPLPVEGPPEMLRRLVELLLVDELTMVPAGGKVSLSVAAIVTATGRMARLGLTDDAPPLPQETVSLVLNPFAAEGIPTEYGLNLLICSLLARHLGGTISVEAAPLGGNLLVVELPALSWDLNRANKE